MGGSNLLDGPQLARRPPYSQRLSVCAARFISRIATGDRKMTTCAVVYASRLVASIGPEKFDRILEAAAHFNHLAGVTGLLACDGRRIVQYIEGPEDGVRVAYARICTSSSHTDILELSRGHVDVRMFPAWSMRAVSIPAGSLARLTEAQWSGFRINDRSFGGVPTGLDQLAAIGEVFVPSSGPDCVWH